MVETRKSQKMLPSPLVQRILQRFPTNLSYCFAYGSGVKKQTGYNDKAQKAAMIDLILCVDDEHQFHGENLERNPTDYSWMKYFGKKFIANYQDYAAGVYFNTLIPIDNNYTIKYGVIRTSNLCDDLCHWTHLYIAGRLQKPVETLIVPTNPNIINALDTNLETTLRLALLLLPDRFTYNELFHRIAGISYIGDFRMDFGEKKDKVKNIVDPQMSAFLHLYAPYMRKLKHCLKVPDYENVSDLELEQCKEIGAFNEHIAAMPTALRDAIGEEDGSQMIDSLNVAEYYEMALYAGIHNINRPNSIKQSLKNIPTAGLVKSLRYSARKVMKMFSK